jgi:nucleotide-binding universal stress UspA family protein
MSTPQARPQRIVVGVDMAQTGKAALHDAMKLARLTPTELHVTHVVRVEKNLHDARKLDDLSLELQDRLRALREHVEGVCEPTEGESAFTQEIIFHVRLGDAAQALHQVAIDVDADLIVIGTHGRRGLDKLLLGSVAEELVRTAHLPVLVARPRELLDLRKSERPDPAKPGVNLESGGSLTLRLHLEFRPRTAHIGGLI